MPDFSADILRILSLAPDGLSVRKIVRHVYNAHNTLFQSVAIDEVKRGVTQYLASRSHSPSSPIEHGTRRGIYRLNPRSEAYRQLRLQFSESRTDEQQELTPAPTTPEPSLFGSEA